MAHIFLSQLKTALNNCFDELEQIHFLFSRNPETDFTRKRKLTFKEIYTVYASDAGQSGFK